MRFRIIIYTKDELGRPVLTVHGAALGGGDFMADGSVAMEGNLRMDGNAILGVKSISNTHKISTDGVAPLYIGSTIETGDVTSPRLTSTSDGQLAWVAKA